MIAQQHEQRQTSAFQSEGFAVPHSWETLIFHSDFCWNGETDSAESTNVEYHACPDPLVFLGRC